MEIGVSTLAPENFETNYIAQQKQEDLIDFDGSK